MKNFHGLTGLAAVLLLAVTAVPAHAGYEYATSASQCTTKVDTTGDGKNLRVFPGTTRFEVFGNAIDGASPPDNFRFHNSGGFSARIITRRGGAENLARGCGAIGSAVVEVSKSLANATSTASHWIEFRMPLGDWTRVPITVLAFPNYALNWSGGSFQTGASFCLMARDGSYNQDLNDTRATIQLPVGHAADSSNCTGQYVEIVAAPNSTVSADLPAGSCTFSVQGVPAWLSLDAGTRSCTSAGSRQRLRLNIDALALRRITTESTSRITVRGGNAALTSTAATLVARPNLARSGFTGVTASPSQVAVGNPVDFQMTFLSSPGVVTWRLTQASCFRTEVPEAPYNAGATYQFFTVPAGQTTATIRVRSVANAGCAAQPTPVQHIFEAWIGDQRVNPNVVNSTAAPGYGRTALTLLAPAN